MDKVNKKSEIVKLIKRRWRQITKMSKSDLTSGMIRVIILCWLVPYLMVSVVLFYSTETSTDEQITDTVTTSTENVVEISKTKILAAIDESKQATYDGVIKNSYTKFLRSGADSDAEAVLYSEVSDYLNKNYKYSEAISSAILLFNRQTTKEFYTYSNVAGATYASISDFMMNAMPTVRAVSRELGTGTRLVHVSGHLYLVRNMVTSNYVTFATLVMELNLDNIMSSMVNVVWLQDGIVFVDRELVKRPDDMVYEEEQKLVNYAKSHSWWQKDMHQDELDVQYDSENAIAYLITEINGQKYTYVVKLDKIGILNEKNLGIYAYVMVVILLIPLLFATFYYFYANISRPINELMLASEKIEAGGYGYKINKFNKNEELGRLVDTFNHMSVSLEESFNRIYAEEVAVRDANMQALQAQINPHFLNNTLEIINWKARMSGNKDVSGMIESLGVMMEATMNRNNESFITIKEEMRYVEAYLYIIVQRFGSKFQFEEEIDESLINIRIPRLIVQPLVENAVEHGGDLYGNRVGKLIISEDDKYLSIIVENNGHMSMQDVEKVKCLLGETKLASEAKNIGIRNVNLRLKLLYGEDSGLFIENKGEDLIVSKILIEKKKLEINNTEQ